MDRRDFIGGLAAAVSVPAGTARAEALRPGAARKPAYHVFSRVFQFLKDPYRAADFLKGCGYDGVEWTARPGGFCEPEKAQSGLRVLRDASDKAGLRAESLVVPFVRGDEPGAERIASAAAEAGFRSFRGGYFRYDRAKAHRANLDAFRRGFDSLAALARRTGLKACYQNHSTYSRDVPLFGSLVWDLASVVKDYDPQEVGVQYDPMHVRAEGGPSWDHTLGAVAPWIDIVCLKDFRFAPDPANLKDWRRVLVPAGRGIVDFAEVRRLMSLEGVAPRFTVHFDYDVPADEAAARACAAADLAHYRAAFG